MRVQNIVPCRARALGVCGGGPSPLCIEIVRCRLLLSTIALGLLLGEAANAPSQPSITAQLILVAIHFVLASAILLRAESGVGGWCLRISPWLDGVFAVALPLANSGARTPFFAFAVFAVAATALDGRARDAFLVTTACIGAYAFAGTRGGVDNAQLAVMRAMGLAILGYLLVLLAQRRLSYEAALRIQEAAAERERLARQLHDGCAALLAAVDIRLEADRELLLAGRYADVLDDLARLRQHVRAEQRDVRAYSRRLAAVDGRDDVPASAAHAAPTPSITLDVRCEAAPDLVDEVLAILRESLRNVVAHAGAQRSTLRVRVRGREIVVDVKDDGVGFPAGSEAPWSIASRVADRDGFLTMRDAGSGAHLSIVLPRS